jgi:hypothetical protein
MKAKAQSKANAEKPLSLRPMTLVGARAGSTASALPSVLLSQSMQKANRLRENQKHNFFNAVVTSKTGPKFLFYFYKIPKLKHFFHMGNKRSLVDPR